MLEHTFCHIKGISLQGESALWEHDVRSWDDVPESRPPWLTPARFARLRAGVEESRRALAAGDARFFEERLPRGEVWRLFGEFRGSTAYFDIETTGLEPSFSDITTIAMFDGKAVRTFVKGRNIESFCDAIEEYTQIVTYNGKCFDVPFVRKKLRAPMEHAHLDLRYLLNRLGYKGGLKGCEKMLGVRRDGVEEVNGFMAVLLWKDYTEGNEKALETLLAYNAADAVNLEILSVKAYNRYLEHTPFDGELTLEVPEPPMIPYRPHVPTIRRLLADMAPWG
ncbi:MAG TPA: ribonuclease H-like domain-containing protein [Spirochaetia bacterium]